jgi:signal peptidase II
LKKYFTNYAFLALIAGIIVLLDQVTKEWVRLNLQLGEVYRPELWLSQYFRIVHWKNTGAAFGMFQDMNPVFMVLSVLVSGVILFYFPQIPTRDWLVRLSMGMLLGGALGNLIDRFRQGYVTDFISVGKFPVLNIADASISVGVAVLFVGMWWQEKKKSVTPPAETELATPSQPGESAAESSADESSAAESAARISEEVQGE